jgi:hypothetical protein
MLDHGHDEADRIDVLGLGLVPNSAPGFRTDTLTSARIEPCSILPSHDPT